MAKPSSKRTSSRKPAAKPVTPAAPAASEAMFDEAAPPPAVPADQAEEAAPATSPDEAPAASGSEEGQGGQEPQAPAPEEPATAGEEDGEQLFDDVFGGNEGPAAEQQSEGSAVQAPEPSVPEPPAEPTPEPAAPSAGAEKVRLGQVEGLLHRVPLEVVQAILGEVALERVGLLRTSASIHDLQKRMRASDGRCAPVIFTAGGPDDVPVIFSGVENVAAAMNVGLDRVSVVTIAPGDAGAVQSWLNQPRAKPAETEEDFLQPA